MAEVIGTAASVITIAQVVIELVKHAKTFYRAQVELDELQASSKILQKTYYSLLHWIFALYENFT